MFGSPNYFLTGINLKPSPTQKGIFGFGTQPGSSTTFYSMTNIVTSAGVVGTNNSTVATAKDATAATTYGGDKGIFGFGWVTNTVATNNRNLVSNTGVLTTDASTSGTARAYVAACGYGKDRGIFGFGFVFYPSTNYYSLTNLVTNTGVIGSDVTGVTAGKYSPAACRFGLDKGIFGFGQISGSAVGATNIVTNTGIMGSDVSAVGTPRNAPAAASYGGDKGIFAYGYAGSGVTAITNAISNTGVVIGDVITTNTTRWRAAGCGYGGDKGIIAFGVSQNGGTGYLLNNLISNTGTFASDTSIASATARYGLSACGFSGT
jgi:hypothetical protein